MTQSDESVRIGLVGAGYIGQIHSAAYRAITGTYPAELAHVTLAAVADADRGKAESIASGWGWERSEADWKTITRSDDIDVVDVSLPNAFHAEVAIDALEHGKHVICEKPLAKDVDGAEAMCQAAAGSDRIAQVCFYYRLWPAIAWAHDLIATGAIGRVRHFRGWMLQDYAASASHDLGWRARRADAGAGALGDLGSHIIDVARYLCGEITEVCARSWSTVDRPGVDMPIDDLVAMMVGFESGASGVLEASWALRGHKCDLGFDLVGDAGAIRFSWEQANQIEVLRGDVDEPGNGFSRVLIGPGLPDVDHFVAVPGQGMGYRDAFTIGLARGLRAMADADHAVGPTFDDGLAVSRTIAAAVKSAEAGGWVDPRA